MYANSDCFSQNPGCSSMDSNDPYFDRNQHLDIKDGGNLPHWHQDGKLQFVTFRLADSLPSERIKDLRTVIDGFNKNHPKPWSADIKQQYWKTVGPMEERLLDNGHGSCLLRDKELRDIVRETILYNDGRDCDIIAFVIMPNHVHLLLHVNGNRTLGKIIQSIKRFSSRKINEAMKCKGKLWMTESFDRIVRSADNLKHYVLYIKENPRHLHPTQYDLFIHPDFDF